RRHSSALCPEHIVRPIRPSRPEAGADSQLPPLRPARGDLPEWKRIEREWERVIPSTSLAGRIQALLRVLEKPERWVERTARRLKPDLVARLRSAPLPHYRKPKLDRSPYGFLSQPLAHSHVLLDTS
ncbi:MAG TPA: hypothetical protein VFV70_01835, partial [Hyphomonadaceae bacterium]|nr:hypothetical protein [Hyphomonadaceae bacterium]